MQHYTMASVINPTIIKQPLKVIEVPLSKFSEEVVPHHQNVFEQYKVTIHKLISVSNFEQVKREMKEKKRTVKQLRDLMYELDTLRTQVEDEDLDKFDIKTLSLRKIILNLINGYTELEKSAERLIQPEESEKENLNPFEGASQIQMQESLQELKLKREKETLDKVENINKDVADLHEMYVSLNEMVGSQAQHVDHTEQTTENTHENVDGGLKHLMKAHKLKAAAYPVTGAFLGGIIGGPIGLIAGLKVGGIAAIGCAIAGYTGGKLFNKHYAPEMVQEEKQATDVQLEPHIVEKKDI